MRAITTAHTAFAGVVGNPVKHSLSPQLHNAALEAAGLDAVYLAFELWPESFASSVRGLLSAGGAGLNVTLPFKGDAHDLCDRLHGAAKVTEAVNTLTFVDGKIHGHNTDVAGIESSLASLGVVDLDGYRVVVLGAGGAASAALCACRDASTVTVVNRTAGRARDLAERFGRSVGDFSALWDADVVINATSLGLNEGDIPVPGDSLDVLAERVVLDLVYRPEVTTFVNELWRRKGVAADGLGMLVAQAAAAFELMWGFEPDLGAMTEAAAEATGRAAGTIFGAPK